MKNDALQYLSRSTATTMATALLLACPGAAQSSGFQPGELILYSPSVQNSVGSLGGIARIDPATGTTSVILDLATTHSRYGGIAFDPYRERLIFYAGFPTTSDPKQLYLLDGLGMTSPLGNAGAGLNAFAPASGGRIYFVRQLAGDIQYLDAADQQHTLLDAGGTQPFALASPIVDAMLYDAGTNSLFVATPTNSLWNCGMASIDVSVTRLQLSVDGSRITSVPGCVQVVVDTASANLPVGLSPGPDGQLLLVVDSNSNTLLPRMTLIDPATLATMPFASNGYTGAAATNAGTWSSTLDRAVILDTFSNVLRAYDLGEAGEGSVIAPSTPISTTGGSGEIASLVEVTPGGRGSLVSTYCQAKLTAAGCLPAIETSGLPSASAGGGFLIEVGGLPPQKPGLFFYGLSGAAAVPFHGGTRCMRNSVRRTPPMDSGGTAACDGTLSIDFNAYVSSGGNPQIGAGSVVHGQFWFRDPAHPVGGVGSSNAVTFTVRP